MAVPKHTPSLEPTSPINAEEPIHVQLPQSWIWIENVSAVRHVLRLHSHGDGEQTQSRQILGSGTFGQCFRVVDNSTAEVFCIKVPTDSVAVRAMRKEFQVMRKLSHPNVLRAVALICSEDNRMQGLLLPLADSNLWTWIGRDTPANNHGGGAENPSLRNHCDGAVPSTLGRHSAQVLLQVARGLSYIHVARVIHLDVKPENLLVIGSDTAVVPCVRLADFGSCRPGPDSQGKGGEHVRADLVNTAVYRPLQLFQHRGSLVKAQFGFDRWAFGCVIFDVAQGPARFRSRTGKALRLFSGLSLVENKAGVLLARNHRLLKYLAASVIPLVLQCQPEPYVVSGSQASSELVLAFEKLVASSA
jgi:hypothetical protein